ncbi:MAG: glycosyltransferase, partial [Caldilineaceae bacterium]|nr:glycosyltransferase [Caldilineaceae bacterium]
LLFAALAQMRRTHPKKAARLQLIFTGTLPEATRAAMVQLGIGDLIQEVGHLPQAAYHRLLRQADLLLAINYTGFTTLIPGKLYEYWAVGAAPFLLLDSGGAASELVAHHQLGTAVPPAAVEQIYAALLMYYQQWAAGKPLQIRREGIAAYDRKVLTRQLAALFNAVVQPSRSGRITATTAHDHNHWSSDERRSNYHQRRLPHA